MFDDSKFWIQSLVRWAGEHLQILMVLHKGDDHRGLILLRQDLKTSLVRFWVQESDADGQRVFRRRFVEDQTMEAADAFIERELGRDDDLWILIHEDSDGALPPILNISTFD